MDEQYVTVIKDARNLHHSWLCKYPSFNDRDTGMSNMDYRNHILSEASVYHHHLQNVPYFAKRYSLADFADRVEWHLRCDIRRLNGVSSLDTKLKALTSKSLGKSAPSLKRFITIGFNHQTYDIKQCLACIQSVLDMSIFKNGEAVFEFHRQNGFHPHCHFILEMHEPLRPSKVVEKIFAVKNMKKIVLSKTFIDVKPCEEYHIKYLNGDKQTDKLDCVEKDKVFRKNNNIPEKLFSH